MKNIRCTIITLAFLCLALTTKSFSGEFMELMNESNKRPVLVISETAPKCLQIAAKDFQEDFYEATGQKLEIANKIPRGKTVIIAGVADSCPILKSIDEKYKINLGKLHGKWETFLIQPIINNNILIVAGSDPRGAMYGIYELSERLLGTDPLKFWTGHIPDRQDKLVWRDGIIKEGPPTFQYRGLFINDENSLLAWKGEKPSDGVVEPEVQAKIIETICRLKGNLIAPAMYAKYMTPETLKLVYDRGLFYTASHMELLLANPMVYWQSFCQEHWNKKFDYSYIKHPEKLRAFWIDSIKRHRDYDNIWPIGLRGLQDWAFWRSDPAAPNTLEGRAGIVGKVLNEQLDMLKQNLPKDISPPVSLALYAELETLYRTGTMGVPDYVTLIWCDKGWVALLRDLPNSEEQKRSGGNGVYFHIGNCDRQLTQWVPLEHLQQEFKKVINHKATKYVLFNVGDIREIPLSIAAGMDLAWNAVPWYTKEEWPNDFLHRWTSNYFGKSAAKKAAELYHKFYELEYPCSCTWVVELMAPYTVSKGVGSIWQATSAINFLKKENDPLLLQAYSSVVDFSKVPQRRGDVVDIKSLRKATAEWDDLYKKALEIYKLIKPQKKQFFFDNMICQLQTSRMINHWAVELLDGFNACEKTDFLSAYKHFSNAAKAMDTIINERKKASHGKWKNWYRGEYYNGSEAVMWALKPEWHSQDAFALADLSKKASIALQQKRLTIVTPKQRDFKITPKQNKKTFTVSVKDNFNTKKITDAYLIISAIGIDNSNEASVVFNNQKYTLPVTGASRNSIFKVDLDSHKLKRNGNLVEFMLNENKSIANKGYSIMNCKLIISANLK